MKFVIHTYTAAWYTAISLSSDFDRNRFECNVILEKNLQ